MFNHHIFSSWNMLHFWFILCWIHFTYSSDNIAVHMSNVNASRNPVKYDLFYWCMRMFHGQLCSILWSRYCNQCCLNFYHLHLRNQRMHWMLLKWESCWIIVANKHIHMEYQFITSLNAVWKKSYCFVRSHKHSLNCCTQALWFNCFGDHPRGVSVILLEFMVAFSKQLINWSLCHGGTDNEP